MRRTFVDSRTCVYEMIAGCYWIIQRTQKLTCTHKLANPTCTHKLAHIYWTIVHYIWVSLISLLILLLITEDHQEGEEEEEREKDSEGRGGEK